MSTLDTLDILFVAFGFLFQIALVVHFAVRRRAFDKAMRYGPLVYALGVPAVLISLAQINAGKPWTMWLAGLLCGVWGLFGYYIEYVRHVEWRSPWRWSIGIPYLALYLATIMFYWWPIGLISRPLWYLYAALFSLSTVLNIASHSRPDEPRHRPA